MSDNDPFTDPDYNTVTRIMEEWYKGKDTLIIDGRETTTGDYRKMATEWMGKSIKLTEMEPTEKQVKELSKWKGEAIHLHLCGHEDYDLGMFISNMNDWDGDVLCIGYSGPRIFTEKVAQFFHNPKYKQLCFQNCDLPIGFISCINEFAPDLHCEEVNTT